MTTQRFETTTDYFKYLREELPQLSTLKQLAFITAIGERAFPFYENFSNGEPWGDIDFCRKALDTIWDYIDGKPLSSQHLTYLQKTWEEVLSQPSEDYSIYYEYALLFGKVLINILYYPTDPSPQHLLEACTFVIDTIDSYIQNNDTAEDLDLDYTDWEQIWKYHPVMVNEQNRQLKDLSMLKQQALNESLMKQIKEASTTISLIPTELTKRIQAEKDPIRKANLMGQPLGVFHAPTLRELGLFAVKNGLSDTQINNSEPQLPQEIYRQLTRHI